MDDARNGNGKRKRAGGSHEGNGNGNASSEESSGEEDGANSAQKSGGRFLTEEEKKRNHLNSEKKRRNQIRKGFTELVQLIPGAKESHRSESDVLTLAVKHVDNLARQKAESAARVKYLQELLARK
ncbi:hypothetical protein M427DRAFT_36510 [Gonapodya prolifera JEL478]|uniref:BHLH domain-containing protein n=1 Tax=Gonapodya prolifera (strain JEL478) TaxID=1344416 RepID=A0A139A2A3_GONPJ|nr:hypothetical protein M427DRAFT_36510 [Gonapodya prolifera JEL478]|eukprot:KXS10907.1 hypothetical protein M427DRAFT_36510 [Gonapodya prolifera JEL478]